MGKYYVGQTKNLDDRLNRHNQGRERYTRVGVPWKLIYVEEVESRSAAMSMEKKIKNLGAKRFLKEKKNT